MMKTPGSPIRGTRACCLILASVLLAACGGDGGPGEPVTPASITATTTVPATLAAGSAVATSPAVVVQGSNNRPFAGATVTFAVTGGGTVAVGTATTNAAGQASAGIWTLGTTPGANTVTATVNGMSAVFTVNTTPDAPATVAAQTDHPASPAVGQTITPAVKIVDRFGNAVPNVGVTFTASAGTVAGGAVTTNAAGIARVAGWTLGTTAGVQKLTATAGALTGEVLVTAAAAAASQVTKQSGDNVSATVSTAVVTRPSVRISDAFNNPVAGVTVTFAVASGGASITGATPVTNATGIAQVGSWTLGTTPGANTLTATIPGGATVTFSATATAVVPPFKVDLRYSSPVTPAQDAAFTTAANRWMNIITADLSNVVVPVGFLGPDACGVTHPAFAEEVDDVVIFVDLKAFDGVGGLLGQAGPCIIRTSNDLPIIGTMQFDVADMANMESNGSLTAVIMHEMGHVLGIGSLWSNHTLISGAAGADPFFSGATAMTSFTNVGGTLVNGVPIENCLIGVPASCGAGTRDSHWRESTFGRELMTGYLNAGPNPLSEVTISSLQDMGYTVSFGTADTYSLAPAVIAGGALQAGTLLHINDIVLKPIGRIKD